MRGGFCRRANDLKPSSIRINRECRLVIQKAGNGPLIPLVMVLRSNWRREYQRQRERNVKSNTKTTSLSVICSEPDLAGRRPSFGNPNV
jgi:hypothetical protein